MNRLISLDLLATSLPQERRFSLKDGELLVVFVHGNRVLTDHVPADPGQTLVAQGPCTLSLQGDQLELVLVSGVPELTPGIERDKEAIQSRTFIFFRAIENACEKYGQTDPWMISSAVLQFLAHWNHRFVTDDSLALKTARWLEAHCRENVTAQDAARALGYSHWHIMHSFSAAFSMSVHEYLMRCRMSRIKKEITAGTRTMEEIALDNGFSSRSAMHKSFRRIYGITPGQYRRCTERNDK